MRVRVASAGTGKTTSLVGSYLALIGGGVPLRRIAGVTFTRDVADELRQRVAAGIGDVARTGSYLGGLYVAPAGTEPLFERARAELGGALLTTIHGFMIAGIRLSAPLLGYDPAFGLLPEWEAQALFDEELNSVALVAARADHASHRAAVVAGPVGFGLAGSVFRLRSLSQTLTFGASELDAAVAELYEEAYARYLRRLGPSAMAPGEVERAALRLLGSPTARERLARRYPVVLVDEYQDVNPLQGEFFERLAEAGVSLEVVGDPKQSIYGFRSADVSVFRRALDAAESSGDLLEPLTASRRHSQAVVAFLNRLTGVMGEAGLGFTTREAPPVTAAGSQAAVAGRVDLIVAERQGPLGDARRVEADLLAERLELAHHDGRAYRDMAVVARQHHLLGLVERALEARGVPTLRLKGSGFYRRNEVRDVYHALRVGVDPAGASLSAFLRGPFGGLGLADLATVTNATEPRTALADVRPDVLDVIDALRRIARLPPIDAVKAVIRTPLAADTRLVDVVDDRGRANVDALLFELAAQTPPDLELLLDRLDELAERAEAADVPEGGEGVRLLTMHGSKGLEYPLVAVFDAGAQLRYRPQAVLVDARTGSVTLHAAGGDERAQAERSERDRHEAYRLLYVAASRARDHLIVTGSVNRPDPQGWLELLRGPVLEGGAPHGTHVTRTSEAPARRRPPPREHHADVAPLAAPWIDSRFEHHPYEPLSSPSRLVGLLAEAGGGVGADAGSGEGAATGGGVGSQAEATEPEATEPLAAGESILSDEWGWQPSDAVDAGEPGAASRVDSGDLPGRGRVVGTLVHFAISQDWEADDVGSLDSLRAQEVMFPYSAEQRDELLAEVSELLRGYQDMLGAELPSLSARTSDRAEVPLAVRGGSTVWEGVIDRLYAVGGRWVIDDYKTDRVVRPERYHLQLGLYLHAVERAIGTRPVGRLVYLRSRTVVEPADEDLRGALQASGIVDVSR